MKNTEGYHLQISNNPPHRPHKGTTLHPGSSKMHKQAGDPTRECSLIHNNLSNNTSNNYPTENHTSNNHYPSDNHNSNNYPSGNHTSNNYPSDNHTSNNYLTNNPNTKPLPQDLHSSTHTILDNRCNNPNNKLHPHTSLNNIDNNTKLYHRQPP
ncbi:putative uncharacterized protein DDB_G0288037 [Macrobrachium rosenbergii]|uniref:putative uncharacterized protein DDB_G0288037 n=1 Tax=Macrobrachium rosenbergii TaxID=79674 RepID=UPI0034D53D10